MPNLTHHSSPLPISSTVAASSIRFPFLIASFYESPLSLQLRQAILFSVTDLNEKLLDLDLHAVDCALKLRSFVGGDGAGDDWTRNAAGTAEGDLAGNEDVRDVLVLAEEGQMEENLDRFGVGGHDDHLTDTTVQCLGGLVGTLLGLLVVRSLLDEVEQGYGELGVGEGKGFLTHGCVDWCDDQNMKSGGSQPASGDGRNDFSF